MYFPLFLEPGLNTYSIDILNGLFYCPFDDKKMKKDILGGESVEVFIVKENLASVKNFYVVNGVFHLLFLKFVNRVNLLELVRLIIPLFNPTRI